MGGRSHRIVLFLCTGNYYRSRYAECLFNAVAGNMGLPWRAASRGLALERGYANIGPMAASAVEALQTRGCRDRDALARMPAALTLGDLTQAARVIALQLDEHRPLVEKRFPAWLEKVEFWHVDDDPAALERIEREVMALVARLLGGGHAPPEPEPTQVAPAPSPKPLTAKVGRETAGRKGKGVTPSLICPSTRRRCASWPASSSNAAAPAAPSRTDASRSRAISVNASSPSWRSSATR